MLAESPRCGAGIAWFTNNVKAGKQGGLRGSPLRKLVAAMDAFEQITRDLREFAVEVKRLGYSMPPGYENRFLDLSERILKRTDDLARSYR
jgi:hypothetical protein